MQPIRGKTTSFRWIWSAGAQGVTDGDVVLSDIGTEIAQKGLVAISKLKSTVDYR